MPEAINQPNQLMVCDQRGQYLPASVEQIIEAARQAIERKMCHGMPFTCPADVKSFLCTKLGGLDHEVFSVLFLDGQHRLIEFREMFRGTINAAAVYPREVVKAAMHLNASAVILSHNHPSGSKEPSNADRMITMTLKKALDLVDVRTLDHVIVAGNEALSMAEAGMM